MKRYSYNPPVLYSIIALGVCGFLNAQIFNLLADPIALSQLHMIEFVCAKLAVVWFFALIATATLIRQLAFPAELRINEEKILIMKKSAIC